MGKFKDKFFLNEVNWNALLKEIERLEKKILTLSNKLKNAYKNEKADIQKELTITKRILSQYKNIQINQANI